MGRTRKEVFVVIVVDECFGDDALIDPAEDRRTDARFRELILKFATNRFR
jgi:hypothetical protein